jgi:hypothetical protein
MAGWSYHLTCIWVKRLNEKCWVCSGAIGCETLFLTVTWCGGMVLQGLLPGFQNCPQHFHSTNTRRELTFWIGANTTDRPLYLLLCLISTPLRLQWWYHADPLLKCTSIVICICMPNPQIRRQYVVWPLPTHHPIWWRTFALQSMGLPTCNCAQQNGSIVGG